MRRRALSLLWWAFIVVSSLVLFPVAVLLWALTTPLDPQRRLLHRFTCLWASLYSWCNPAWRVAVRGREKIDPAQTYVMVANHRSLADILVLFRLFTHFKWVAKRELFRVPCIGWNMALNGYVPLRRGDRASIADMMETCLATLGDGNSIMMFPEGTRSPDGHLAPFKHGAFTLAQRARVPLLPIVIEGTAAALPRRGFVLQGRHQLTVRVLDPLPVESFRDRPIADTAAHVHALFRRELGLAAPAVVAAQEVIS